MNFNLLSKRRNELMGIAIIATLVCHWKECFECNGQPIPMIAEFLSLGKCGVDIFFILSGIGLYYSFTQDSRIGSFYKKRFMRLLPTYFVIAIPYWILRDGVMDGSNFVRLVLDLFFITFFTEGVKRFWFIAAIMIFYLLFPWIYKLLFFTSRIKLIEIKFALLFVLVIIIDSILSMRLYIYDNIAIMMGRIPSFIIGIYLGYKSFHKQELKPYDYFIAPILLLINHAIFHIPILYSITAHLSGYYQVTLLGLTVIEIFLIIYEYVRIKSINKIMVWFGGITLEIYIIHSALKNLFAYPYNLGIYICICIIAPVILAYVVHKVIDCLLKKFFNAVQQKTYKELRRNV